MSTKAYLTYTFDGHDRRLDCTDVMTIGRDEPCTILLPDPRVSRQHAMLYRTQDGSYYIADEGSSNGSFVNAARISLPTRLNDGDQISIGSVNIQFHNPVAVRSAVPNPSVKRTTVIVQHSVEIVRNAILVADIRGFTKLSEAIPVRELTDLMNNWFRECKRCIEDRDGLIDKFLGDCVYARWEANRDPNFALLRALDSACELHRITVGLGDKHTLPHPLNLGVGINVGNAAIGTEQSRTAIGDAVNLTFRLQEQTKKLGKDILLNREAYINLPDEMWNGREQSVTVAGKTQPLDVWGISFGEAQDLLAKLRQP